MMTNVKFMVVLSKLAQSFNEPLKNNLESLGISVSAYLSLAHLATVEKDKVQKLGRVASISSGTITHTINKLLKDDLIERIQDSDDKRVFWLKITEKGLNRFNEVHAQHMIYLDSILSPFSESEKNEFIEQVKYFGKTIEKEI